MNTNTESNHASRTPPSGAVATESEGAGGVTRSLLRYHGGKWRLAPWIVSHFPLHHIYVEPFGGAASVLLVKGRSRAEIYNDLDGEIVNLFRVVRERGTELLHAIELTPYAREEFDLSFFADGDPVEQARRTVVRSFMGFGGNLTRLTKAGRLERTGFRDYSKKNRRSIPAQDWRNWPAGLVQIIERLQGVIVEHRAAAAVIEEHDAPMTLHYVDPPYVHSTRFVGGKWKPGYRHEMTNEDHRALAELLRTLRGMVCLSGYPCALYEELYGDWRRVQRATIADGARKRVEVLWMNYDASHGDLFMGGGGGFKTVATEPAAAGGLADAEREARGNDQAQRLGEEKL